MQLNLTIEIPGPNEPFPFDLVDLATNHFFHLSRRSRSNFADRKSFGFESNRIEILFFSFSIKRLLRLFLSIWNNIESVVPYGEIEILKKDCAIVTIVQSSSLSETCRRYSYNNRVVETDIFLLLFSTIPERDRY